MKDMDKCGSLRWLLTLAMTPSRLACLLSPTCMRLGCTLPARYAPPAVAVELDSPLEAVELLKNRIGSPTTEARDRRPNNAGLPNSPIKDGGLDSEPKPPPPPGTTLPPCRPVIAMLLRSKMGSVFLLLPVNETLGRRLLLPWRLLFGRLLLLGPVLLSRGGKEHFSQLNIYSSC
jgi:hypothetical protein